MSLSNITTLNLSLQTQGAALAAKYARRLVAPARQLYVYGTADGLAPNFTSVAEAVAYAQGIGASPAEPVVINLFSKADGTPYDLTGFNWYTL